MTEQSPDERAFYRAQDLFRKKQYKEAVQALSEGLESNPSHPWCNSLLGAALIQMGQPKEAGEYLRKAVELSESTDPGIVRNFAFYLLDYKNDAKSAEDLLKRALKTRKHMLNYALYGYVLERQGKSREARANYLEALRRPFDIDRPSQGIILDEWYSIAQARFVLATLNLVSRSKTSKAPKKSPWAIIFRYVLAAVLLVIARWFDRGEVAFVILIIFAALPVLLPYLLEHPRIRRFHIGGAGFKLDLHPDVRYGPDPLPEKTPTEEDKD